MSAASAVRCLVCVLVAASATPLGAQEIAKPDENDSAAFDICRDGCDEPRSDVDVHPDDRIPRTYSFGAESSLTFTVENDGNMAASFSLDCSESTVTCTGLSASSVFVQPGYSTQVRAFFRAEPEGNRTLRLLATGPHNSDYGSYALYVANPHTLPVVDASVHNGENLDVARCVLDCLHAVMSYSTPAYFSLDTPRSVTLVYRSEQARPRPFVQVQATDTSSDPAQKFSVRLRRRWDGAFQTLLNGSTELFYWRETSGTNRLAAQFDATSFATGAYGFDVIVTSHWADETRETIVPITVIVVNEEANPLGWGWSMAGLQHIHRYSNKGTNGVLITEGDGSARFFGGTCSFTTSCSFSSPAGDFTTLTYSGADSTFLRTYPDGTIAAFYADGRLSHVTDRFGNQSTYAWKASQVMTIEDPAGHAITFGYGGDGRIDWVRGPDGRTSTFAVSGGNVASITDPSGEYALRASYDGYHRMYAYRDRAGKSWIYAYDPTGRLQTITAPAVEVDGEPADVRQPVTTIASGQIALLQSVAAGSGSETAPLAARDADSWRHDVTSPGGSTTRFVLNRWQQPVEIHEAYGTAIQRTTTNVYNAQGQLRGSLGPTHHTDYTWSGPVLTGRTNYATGGSITWEYDATRYYGLVRTSGDAVARHFFLNPLGLPDSVKVATEAEYVDNAEPTTFQYDARGRLTASIDPDGHITEYAYASTGFQNLLWRSRPMNGWNSKQRFDFGYDGSGRRTMVVHPVIDAERDTTAIEYDVLNRALHVIDRAGDTTHTDYQDALNRVVVTDAIEQQYDFQYDALGRLIWEEDPRGERTYFGYDLDGNTSYTLNRRNQAVRFAYDDLGRLTARQSPDGNATFSYPSFLETIATNAEGTVSAFVDDAGRPDSLIAASGTLVDWRWSVEDRGLFDIRVSTPWETYQTYYGRYAGSRQLRGIGVQGSGETTFHYDEERQLTSVGFPFGAGSIGATHDSRHMLQRLDHSPPAADSAFSLFYDRDTEGRVTGRYFATGGDASADSVWDYTYDDAGRLESAARSRLASACSSPCGTTRSSNWILNFAWDAVGNPAGAGALVTTGNRLEQYTTLAGDQLVLTYDADGNLVRKERNGVRVADYTWNALGQLTNVSTPLFDLEFGYDAFGNRVRRDHDGLVTQYVWAGGNLLAELDASGALNKHYSYYGGIDRPLSVYLESTDSAYFYVTRPPGHVVGLLDQNGGLAARYEYGPFGLLLRGTGPKAATNLLRYGAREYDDIAGLYYNRARWYDPEIGRFISEDPIGLAGGINPYAYAAGNPLAFTDPTGLVVDDPDPDQMAVCGGMCVLEGITVVALAGFEGSLSPGMLDFARPPGFASASMGGGLIGTPGTEADETDPDPDPDDFLSCVAQVGSENHSLTHLGLGTDAVARWSLRGARSIVGGMYVGSNGAPGVGKLFGSAATNRVTRTPSFIARGVRAGARVAGRAAIGAAAVTTAKAVAVGAAGFELGILLGSYGGAFFTCAGR